MSYLLAKQLDFQHIDYNQYNNSDANYVIVNLCIIILKYVIESTTLLSFG